MANKISLPSRIESRTPPKVRDLRATRPGAAPNEGLNLLVAERLGGLAMVGLNEDPDLTLDGDRRDGSPSRSRSKIRRTVWRSLAGAC